MDYFEFYNIPVSFHPDKEVIKKNFYALSKQYHPDFYIGESEAKQQEILELSTLNNKAFHVLKDDDKVLKYILELKSMIAVGDTYKLPQSFLMEMMDVNEAIMDLQFEKDETKLLNVQKEIELIEQSLALELRTQTENFELLSDDEQQDKLLKIKDIFYRGNYVRRLKESVAKIV